MNRQMKKVLDGYFRHQVRSSRSIARTSLASASAASVASLVHFARAGARNEADAYLLAVHAQPLMRSQLWRLFAPFWIADEARHSLLFHQLLLAVDPRDGALASELLAADEAHQAHRDAVYSTLLRSEVHVWAAIALDEWNTAREYVAAGRTLFACLGPSATDALSWMAADESQHHQVAVAGLSGFDRELVDAVLDEVVAIAESSDGVAQFAFDQEPVGDYVPSYTSAAASIRRSLTRWNQRGALSSL